MPKSLPGLDREVGGGAGQNLSFELCPSWALSRGHTALLRPTAQSLQPPWGGE